jgi:hypothetical protein
MEGSGAGSGIHIRTNNNGYGSERTKTYGYYKSRTLLYYKQKDTLTMSCTCSTVGSKMSKLVPTVLISYCMIAL